jgi:hypothetical protein
MEIPLSPSLLSSLVDVDYLFEILSKIPTRRNGAFTVAEASRLKGQ